MSLILEALKKLEREKQSPERGVVVLANAAWTPASAGSRAAWWPWALVGTVVLAGAAWAWTARTPPVTEATPSAPRAVARSAPAAVTAAPVPIAVAPVPTSRPVRRPDPPPDATAALPVVDVAAPDSAPVLRLSAISSRDGHPVAVVNDQVVQVGDLVDGARVVAIGAASVEVEVAGRRQRIGF